MTQPKNSRAWSVLLPVLVSVAVANGQQVTVTHNADHSPEPGDVITVTAMGPARGRAVFALGDAVKDQPMREARPGQYQGEYTVRKGDKLDGLAVVVSLTVGQGRTFTGRSENAVGRPVPPPQPTAGEHPTIRTVSHSATDWLKGGETIEFTVDGTPAAVEAYVILPGLAPKIALAQVQPGHYVGRWPVPVDRPVEGGRERLVLAGVPVVARLVFADDVAQAQADLPLGIDTVPPRLSDFLPAPDRPVQDQRPLVAAVFEDVGGSGVPADQVVIELDRIDVTNHAVILPSAFSYRPPENLTVGDHRVGVAVTDVAGNRQTAVWVFKVEPGVEPARALTHDSKVKPGPGDVINIRLQAEPGAKAVFSIGNVVQNQALAERQPGVYLGQYTVRKGEDLGGQPVIAVVTTKDGRRVEVRAADPIPAATTAPPPPTPTELKPPVITAPKDGERVDSPLVIRGTAKPGAKVRISITWQGTTGVLFEMRGELPEQLVDVAQDGTYATGPVDLTRPPLSTGRTTYTIKAVAEEGGQKTAAVVITVSR